MCLRFCSVLSILAVIFIQTSVAKPDDSADVQELKRLEKVWNDAYVRADADALEQLCADDLVVTMTDMVVLNKRSSIAILRSGRSSLSAMKHRTSASTFMTGPLS